MDVWKTCCFAPSQIDAWFPAVLTYFTMIRKMTFVFIVLIAVSLFGHAHAENSYTIAVPMVDGLDATNLKGYLDKMAIILSKKLGAEIKTKPLVYRYGDSVMDMVLDDFEAGNSDLGYVYGREYAAYRNKGDDQLVPLFTLAMFKSTIMKQCFYTRIGEFESVADLRGKKWAGSTYLPARYMLYSQEIDEPLDKFFGSINYISDAPLKNMTERMRSGELDVFSSYDIIMKVSGETDKKDAFLEPLYCNDYDHTWVFVARRGVSSDILERMRTIVLNA
ncbi:hypothetical protein ACFLQK_02565, partial [bacterium]